MKEYPFAETPMRLPVAAALALAALASPALGRAQDPSPARDSIRLAEIRSAQEGARDGREAARRRGVAWRGVVGFVGGLPIGQFAMVAGGMDGNPMALGSLAGVAGLVAVGGAGAARPPLALVEVAARRGPAYQCAYTSAYRETLRERRRSAAFSGSLVGTLTGALSVLALLGAMAGGT